MDRVAPYGLSALVTGQAGAQSASSNQADIDRIKENIERMIDLGAPESEIDEYVASEGVSAEQLRGSASAGTAAPWTMGQETMDFLTMGGQSKLNAAGVGLIDATVGAIQGKGWDFSTPYNRELAEQRAAQEQYGQQHPVKKRVGQAAGLGVGIARLPAISAFKGAGLLPRTGNAAITAGTYGGIGGAIQDADSISERLQNTSVGAGIGSILGSAAPLAGRAIGASWNSVANWLSNRGIQSPAAVRKILERLQATGLSPAQAQQRLDELGPEGMLADVNPGMQVVTGATASRDPGAGALVSERLGGRMDRAPQRIAQDLDATIGPPADPYAQMQSNRAQRGSIGPQYEDALTNAPAIPPEVRLQIADRLSNARYTAAERDTVIRWLRQIDDAFDAPSPEATAGRLQRIRQALDAEIETDQVARFGYSSKDKAAQGILSDIRGAVDDALKTHVPGFREADEAFAPIARQQSAYESGRRALRDDVSVGQHRANVAGYSAPERQMSNAGMRYDIEQKLDRPRQNPGLTIDRILGSNAAQQKLEASIGTQGAERLRRGIGREETFTETSNLADVRRNSRTAPLTQVSEEMWGRSGRGLLGDVTSSAVGGYAGGGVLGATGAAIGTIGRRLGGQAAGALGSGLQRTIRETADRLTSTGAQRDKLIRQLQQMAARLPQNQRTARNIEIIATKVLTRSVGLLSPTAGRSLGLLRQ